MTHRIFLMNPWFQNWFQHPNARFSRRYSWFIVMTFVVACFIVPPSSLILAQDDPSTPSESALKSLYGLDRLKALNYFTNHYMGERKAVRYGKQAVSIGEKIFSTRNTLVDQMDRYHLLEAYVLYGEALFIKEDYFESKDYFYKARSVASMLDTTSFDAQIELHLDKITSLISSGKIKEGFLSKTIGNINLGKAIDNVSGDLRIQTEIKLGENQENKKDFRGSD